MTDADLSREEWIAERIAVKAADGLTFDERQARAEAVVAWERLRLSIKHAPRSHGDGAGARGDENTSGTQCNVSEASTPDAHTSDTAG